MKVGLLKAFRRLQSDLVENLDFEEYIRRYDTEETFFYCYSPYYGYESFYHGYRMEDFDRLARVLRETRGKWLLSNVDHPTVRSAFKDCSIMGVEVLWISGNRLHASQKVDRELLIANYDIEGLLADSFGKNGKTQKSKPNRPNPQAEMKVCK